MKSKNEKSENEKSEKSEYLKNLKIAIKMLFLLSITRMCWNASVSLNSFLVGFTAILIGGIYGISLPVLFFYGTIVFMQLIEYIVWTHPFNSNINKYASMCAAFLLWMQPIAAILTTTYKLPLIIAYSVIGILLTPGCATPGCATVD
jgi:cellulose synthase/poly-beta-1,6-N-acetylglucosamine synthase-like glycosyltransferase